MYSEVTALDENNQVPSYCIVPYFSNSTKYGIWKGFLLENEIEEICTYVSLINDKIVVVMMPVDLFFYYFTDK